MPKVQLNIVEKDGKAMCAYGGKLDGKKWDMGVDYHMYASDAAWTCMGMGKCGVMGSMMTGKLKFKGPKLEAMKVMEPFANFLKLTGKTPATKTVCKNSY
jgi:putative sterol carrier protein